jgi:hypothetical protein
MSKILKGLNESRNYGRDSWDSNMPGYQGDYGGQENFGRKKRDWDENDSIDARLRQQHAQKQEYEKSGKFWLKFKDSQRHLPAGPFIGKQAANVAAIDLLKKQPELKGNLLITAYGPDEKLNELSPETLASYKKKAGQQASELDKAAFSGDGDAKKKIAKANKRFSGIVKATKKEFEQDKKEIDEVQLKTMRKYFAGDKNAQDELKITQMRQYFDDLRKKEEQERKRKQELQKVAKMGSSIKQGVTESTEAISEEELDENLRKWFKEKWVRFGPDGKIRGDCARGDDSEGKPKCLPQAKAHALGKKGRASAGARKRREDPNPERSGKAINVNTKKKSNEGVAEEQLDELSCWSGYHRVAGTKAGFPGSCAKNKTNESEHSETCPHCGGEMVSEELMNEKKDACYYKVKSRYKVWPSAYASGALVKCRKKGASNWGTGGKKNEGVAEGRENYNGLNILLQKDDDELFVKASAGSRELGHVLFVIDGDYLIPQDLEVEERYRGQGIAQTMYDYVKSKGYKIRRSGQQTDAGAGFWAKHRPQQNVWEQGAAEDQLDEKWSKKYKDSINCSNPKGFSQKAHCAGKKKNESAIMKGLKL